MFHADTTFDNEEIIGLPEVEERDLSASLTLRWSRKRKRWECQPFVPIRDAAARTADITMASAACGPC